MNPVVTVLAPGNMGAALAGRLIEGGLEVRTSLAGRSAGSIDRAKAAGLKAVDEAALVDVDFILSVVPPKEAVALANRLEPALKAASRKPVYVDCNAINPKTANRVEAVVSGTGAAFVDGSIIGMPPKEGYAGPAIFVSGERAGDLDVLSRHGLAIRVLSGPVGAASALKMCYGGITKGLIALGSSMVLGAERNGVADALHGELALSQPQLFASFSKSIPDMIPKARRWVAEMEEISEFLGADAPSGRMFAQIAALYAHLASDVAQGDIAALTRFFASPSA